MVADVWPYELFLEKNTRSLEKDILFWTFLDVLYGWYMCLLVVPVENTVTDKTCFRVCPCVTAIVHTAWCLMLTSMV